MGLILMYDKQLITINYTSNPFGSRNIEKDQDSVKFAGVWPCSRVDCRRVEKTIDPLNLWFFSNMQTVGTGNYWLDVSSTCHADVQ